MAKTFLCESRAPCISLDLGPFTLLVYACNMPVAAALQHASCYSPATCQLQLVLNTCSRCMDCKKAVVWYNSVLGPLPSLLALICSCRCAFCKDVINLTAHKNSTRHFNINAGMPLHTTYPHDLNSEFFVSVHYHTACSYPDCKQEDIINCEAAILHHKRYMKWHQLKQAVIILSDDDDVVDSPSRKVPPHPPMFSKLCNLPVATSATCLLQALPTDLTAIADNDVHAQVDTMGEEITQLRAQLVGKEKDLQTALNIVDRYEQQVPPHPSRLLHCLQPACCRHCQWKVN